jgi:hypothetical protein
MDMRRKKNQAMDIFFFKDSESDDEDFHSMAHKNMKLRKLKKMQGDTLRTQLVRQFMAWDETEGAESNLNCFDITQIAQSAVNQYLDQKSK